MSKNEFKEDDSSAGDEAAPKKKSLLPIIIIAAVVLLLGGGGAAAYFMGFFGGASPPTAEEGTEHAGDDHTAEEETHAEAEDTHAEAADDHGKGGDGHGDKKEASPNLSGGPGAYFLKIPDIIVNLSSTERQPRYLRLGIQLEVQSPSDAAKLEAIMPRVIDQFQTYLRELRVKDLRGSAGIYRLQLELLARVNRAAAPVKVKDVLFQEILIQ